MMMMMMMDINGQNEDVFGKTEEKNFAIAKKKIS